MQILDKPQNVQPFLPRLEITPEERLRHLIEEHKGRLAASFEELLGGGGSLDETADDMIKTVRQWRDFPVDNSFN